jgi:hypothetical protein
VVRLPPKPYRFWIRQTSGEKIVRAYFSAVIPSSASAVWALARDFGNDLLFISGRGEAFVEDGKSGDSDGAVRNATLDGRNVRQRLLAHSDLAMFHQYEFCDRAPFPIENYRATLQFRPIDRHSSNGPRPSIAKPRIAKICDKTLRRCFQAGSAR